MSLMGHGRLIYDVRAMIASPPEAIQSLVALSDATGHKRESRRLSQARQLG